MHARCSPLVNEPTTPTAGAKWRGRLADPMAGAVLALGITQITAWGTSYYCLGVLAGPISQDTGWRRGFVFLGFTVALLAMGIVSRSVGRAIDRHGARTVMTLGTILVSAGLFALAHVRSEAAYLSGYSIACCVLCRAVVEAALKETVERILGERINLHYVTLSDLIMRSAKLLPDDVVNACRQIKSLGDKAAHRDTVLTADEAYQALTAVQHVLKSVFARPIVGPPKL